MPEITKKITNFYLRVSTDDQAREGNSLENQEVAGDRIVSRREDLIKGIVYRDVESGYEIERPGYQQMLRDAKAGKFQVLVIWRLDRLTRNTMEGLRAVEFLVEKLGIEIISATENLDFKTARGKRNVREDLVEAEYYRDRLKENVMPGMIRGVQKGHWQGARYPRYGYRYDKPNRRLVEVENEIKVVRDMWRFRAEGMAIYGICLKVAEMGIRNRVGRLFTTRQVKNIVTCSFYVDGHLVWNGTRSEKPVVEPIIDKETAEKVLAVNQAQRHESKTVQPGRITSPYIFQGVLKCGYCGGNMVGQRRHTNRPKGIKVPWYICGQYIQRTRKACKGQCVRADAVHDMAFGILKKVLQNPQLIELTRAHLKDLLEYSFPHLARRMRELRAIFQRLKREEEKNLQAYHLEAITTDQLKAENIRILNERQSTEREMKEIEAKLSGAVAQQGKVNQVFELLHNFEPIWMRMQPVQQRVIYRGIFNYFYVEGRKYTRQYQIRDFSLKEPFKSWYHNKLWEGPLLINEAGNALSSSNVDNAQQDKDLCQKYIFAPSDVR